MVNDFPYDLHHIFIDLLCIVFYPSFLRVVLLVLLVGAGQQSERADTSVCPYFEEHGLRGARALVDGNDIVHD